MVTPRLRAYTTRKMPHDLLKRMRIVAALMTADADQRVTLEWVLAEVIRRGLPLLENEVMPRRKPGGP